jgi:ankyrin repeat protein
MKIFTPAVFLVLALVTSITGSKSAEAMGQEMHARTIQDVFPDSKLQGLARAACEGDREAIHSAIKGGVNPNGIGARGFTPLFWTLECENIEGIEALLQMGANPNLVSARRTAVTIAASMKNSAVLRLLLKYHGDPNQTIAGSPLSPLELAMSRGVSHKDWDNYYALLNAGADINREYAGRTIVEFAASLRQFDKVEELLTRGYSGDMLKLGGLVQNGPEVDATMFPAAAASRQRVIDLLRQRGVHFPVPSGIERNAGYVSMSPDGIMTAYWMGGRRPDGSFAKERKEVIKPDSPAYHEMLTRIGGLTPNHRKGIPRSAADPVPYVSKEDN